MKTSKPAMNSTVSQEFGMFCSHRKHLKQILAETQICFKQINDAANINGSQLSAAELSEVEEKELELLVRRPPGIVILGQTAQAKATIVNEILGKEILPAYSGSECSIPEAPDRNESVHSKWRAVRLRYGKKQRVAFCLANSFELVGEGSCTEKTWTTVPLDVLRADGADHSTLTERNNHEATDVEHQESNSDTQSLEEQCDVDVTCTEEIAEGNDDPENEICNSDLGHLPFTRSSSIKRSTVQDEDMNDIDAMCTCSQTDSSRTNRQESHDEVLLTADIPSEEQKCNEQNTNVIVEVTLNHPLFNDGAQIIVDENADDADVEKMTLDSLVAAFTTDLVPIFVYALSRDIFSKQEIVRLKRLRELLPGIAVFFVKVPQVQQDKVDPSSPISSIRCMLEHQVATSCNQTQSSVDGKNITRRKAVTTAQASLKLFQQLLEIGYLNILPGALPTDRQSRMVSDSDSADYYAVESELAENFDNFSTNFVEFVHKVLHCHLVKVIGLLNVIHTRCLQTFIQSAFDMARDMMITPKRITFAKEKESELYTSLMTMALRKQDEIRKIIAETVAGKKDELIEKAANYEFVGVEILPTGEVSSSSDLKKCTRQIQDLVLGDLNNAIGDKLLGSVDILKDSYTGVLTRCLESLEQSDVENNKEMTRTSMALREILTSAYQVEITVRAGASIVKVLLEKMKQLMHSMPWHQAPRIDREWKKQVATNMLKSLSEARLAKSVCSQIKERLKYSHETFSAALKQLEVRHSGRLERTEEQRFRVRKVHAPRVARLALESTSFKDLLVYGMPTQGREIGRGQYGVVHACDKWGGFSPCAIKSVVPPDDRHWNDLAMEFFYTKNVPEHDRIVALRGSIVDHSYSGDNPAVLLIMDRLVQDLYTAIRSGLSWPNRLQVAIDVVEGIRYLHSQGLVHRDIKLKNVLLDKHNRGKLTDLGFCKPEAMMSGSIVGTPIHMAPELFSGHYDNSVDTYAFGILFWYVCAGHVHLPYNFEQCTNKEMLWTSVRRGVRPEKLPQFDEGCWELMQSCWDADPSRRPLLGFVEPKLRSIHAKVLKHKSAKSRRKVPVQQESDSQGGANS